jgi:hypothetical protein
VKFFSLALFSKGRFSVGDCVQGCQAFSVEKRRPKPPQCPCGRCEGKRYSMGLDDELSLDQASKKEGL